LGQYADTFHDEEKRFYYRYFSENLEKISASMTLLKADYLPG
jgi:hypothetical protein